MAFQRIGTCSLCGGDVVGHRGAWMATVPPPPDTCQDCGAVRDTDLIRMVRPAPRGRPVFYPKESVDVRTR